MVQFDFDDVKIILKKFVFYSINLVILIYILPRIIYSEYDVSLKENTKLFLILEIVNIILRIGYQYMQKRKQKKEGNNV